MASRLFDRVESTPQVPAVSLCSLQPLSLGDFQDHVKRFPPLGFQTVQIMFTRGRSQFRIKASGLRATYETLFSRTPTVKDANCSSSAQETLLSYCLPFLQQLVPETKVSSLKLEDIMHFPSYNLKAILTEISDAVVCILGSNQCLEEKPWNLQPTGTSDLPPVCEAVPRIPASR